MFAKYVIDMIRKEDESGIGKIRRKLIKGEEETGKMLKPPDLDKCFPCISLIKGFDAHPQLDGNLDKDL